MQIYRFLTGTDDAAFCRRVTESLNQGRQLYGSPQLSCAPDRSVRCGQAIVKEVDADYDPDKPLNDY